MNTGKILFAVFVCIFAVDISAQHSIVVPQDSINEAKIDSLIQTYNLPEITVSAVRPLIKVELDKIIYNTAEDADSKTSTVLDMLKKVPLVTVDGNDKISLKGSSDFVVYMNGKPSGMFRQNPEEVLKNMSANTVKNIEVITEPGAKFDAEGVAGIINIISTSQTSMDGVTATVTADTNTQGGGNAGISLRAQKGRIGFTGNLNVPKHNYPSSDVRQTLENFRDNSIIIEKAKTDIDQQRLQGSGELSFEIDTLNLINAGYNIRYGRQNNSWDGMLSQSQAGNFIYSTDRTENGNSDWGGTDFNIDYQRTSAENTKRFLTLSYRFSYSPRNTENENHFFNPTGDFPAFIPLDRTKQYTDARTNEHTFQADYSTPFGKIHSLETGVKYILRQNKSNSDYLVFNENDSWQSFYPPDDARNDVTLFEHRNDILAAYGSYALQSGNWGLRTGLRYEYTFLNVEFERNTDRNFEKHYGNLVPSILGTYKINDTQTIRLGYNMRLMRPNIRQLNPYIDDSNPNFPETGNPHLEAMLVHSISLNYGFFKRKFNFNANLAHNFSDNLIEQTTRIQDDGKSIASYENIGKNKNILLTAYFNWTPVEWFKLYSNLGGTYADRRANDNSLPARTFSYGWVWGGFEYRLPWKVWLTGSVSANSPHKTLQMTQTNTWQQQFSLRKSFANDRLNVRLYTRNPFNKYFEQKITAKNPDFYQEQNLTVQRRYVGVVVSYRFGELKAKLKKTAKSIKNDDVIEGEQNQDGGK